MYYTWLVFCSVSTMLHNKKKCQLRIVLFTIWTFVFDAQYLASSLDDDLPARIGADGRRATTRARANTASPSLLRRPWSLCIRRGSSSPPPATEDAGGTAETSPLLRESASLSSSRPCDRRMRAGTTTTGEDLRMHLLNGRNNNTDGDDGAEHDDGVDVDGLYSQSINETTPTRCGGEDDDSSHRVEIFMGNTAFAAPREPDDPPDVEWFEWTCFVRPKHDSDLDLIESVAFTLHPTFSPSRVVVEAAAARADDGRFAVSRRGWCAFPVGVEVTDCNGVVHSFTHELSFVQRAGSPGGGSAVGTRRSRGGIARGWWWRGSVTDDVAVVGVECHFDVENFSTMAVGAHTGWSTLTAGS